MKKLSPRQKAFVTNYVKTSNATQSYKQAGFTQSTNAAAVNASNLLRTTKIETAIETKTNAIGISDSVLHEVHQRGLKALKDNGKEDNRTQAIYLDMGYKLKGSYSPDKLDIHSEVNDLSLERLREYRAKLLKEQDN